MNTTVATEPEGIEEIIKPEERRDFLIVLKALGVASVVVEYSGGGDDGSVNGVSFQDAQGAEIDVSDVPQVSMSLNDNGYKTDEPFKYSLEKAATWLCYAALEHGQWDWVNNEGGQGELVIDLSVSPPTITLQHNQNVQTSEYHEVNL